MELKATKSVDSRFEGLNREEAMVMDCNCFTYNFDILNLVIKILNISGPNYANKLY